MTIETKETRMPPWIDEGLTKTAEWMMSRLSEADYETLTVLHEQDFLLTRAPGKYEGMVASLSIIGTFNPLSRIFHFIPPEGLYPALQTSYYFGRAVDDVADGDRRLPEGFNSFSEWITHLKHHIDTDGRHISKEVSIDFLLKRTLFRLEPLQRKGDDVNGELHNFLDAMQNEHDRRESGIVYTATELQVLNQNSYSHVHNIALISMKSSIRANNIPEFAQVLGRAYTTRDLKDDLSQGICNVPKGIIESSGLTARQLFENPNRVKENEVIQRWVVNEISECRELVEILDGKDLDIPAKLLVKFLTEGIRRYIFNPDKKKY